MAYTDETLNNIRQSVDIVDIVDQVVPLKKAGKEFEACCPFHEEKTPSFKVSADQQAYYCHGACGDGGDVFEFYQLYHKVPFPEAVRELAKIGGVDLPEAQTTPSQDAENRARAAALEILDKARSIYQTQLTAAPAVQELLAKRGVSSCTADKFALGAALPKWRGIIDKLGGFDSRKPLYDSGLAVLRAKTESEKGAFYDNFRDSLIFPIRDPRGRVVSFAQRRLSEEPVNGRMPPKYKNGPETAVFKKSQVAYGLYELLAAKADTSTITVTEGYMDVIAAHQVGMENTVGTMGTSISPAFAKTLYRHTDHLVFCFDGDKAGQQAAQRALYAVLPTLNDQQKASFVFLPHGEDIDSFVQAHGADAYQQYLRNQALPASDYIMRLAKNGAPNLDSAEARGQFFANAKSLLDQMPPSGTKSVIMGRLENMTGIRPSEYLPYSIDMQQGHFQGVDLGKLEGEVREFIAQKIGAPASDISVNWSMPEVGPRQGPVVPKVDAKNVQKNIGVRMREVGRILSMDNTVATGLTLAQLLKTANIGTGESQLMAKGLISRYLKDTNAFEVQCQLARKHMSAIREDVAVIEPTMTQDAKDQLRQWTTGIEQRAQHLGSVSDHLDPVTAQKIERHIQSISDCSEATRVALQSTPKEGQQPHPQSGATVRR